MKKVGIVTIYRNNKNFGGLLQAYALIKTVEKCGCKAEVFDYVQGGLSYKLHRFQNLGFHRTMQYFKNKLITELNYRKHPDVHRGVLLRNKRLHDFEVSLPHSAPVGDAEVTQLAARYDCLIAGSDQIWNPGLWNPVMFLDIDGFKGCRFSYAASMGRDRLTASEASFLRKHIKSLDAVSVREESAGRIISSVTGKSVLTVCYPTCLLSTDEWSQFAVRPDGVPDDFVFSFFLGENKNAKSAVYSHFKGKLPVVTIPHLQTGYKAEDEQYNDIKLYDVGCREWVWLILNARYIFTDSFHGTAFSVNLGRNFFSFPKGSKNDKQSINSRLTDLLDMCSLKERFVDDISLFEEKLEMCSGDAAASENFNLFKTNSFDFLRGMLEHSEAVTYETAAE